MCLTCRRAPHGPACPPTRLRARPLTRPPARSPSSPSDQAHAPGWTSAPPTRRRWGSSCSAGCPSRSARRRRRWGGTCCTRSAPARRHVAGGRRAGITARRGWARAGTPGAHTPRAHTRAGHAHALSLAPRPAHLGRLVGVVLAELEQQVKRAALPRRVVGPKDDCLPHHHVAAQRRGGAGRRRGGGGGAGRQWGRGCCRAAGSATAPARPRSSAKCAQRRRSTHKGGRALLAAPARRHLLAERTFPAAQH